MGYGAIILVVVLGDVTASGSSAMPHLGHAPGGARHDFAQSHPRQWVDRSSTAYRSAPDPLSNPTQAAGRSSKHSRPVASEHSPPTLCDAPQAQRFVLAPFNKQDLNDPPTAVGGIRSNPFAFVVGWA